MEVSTFVFVIIVNRNITEKYIKYLNHCAKWVLNFVSILFADSYIVTQYEDYTVFETVNTGKCELSEFNSEVNIGLILIFNSVVIKAVMAVQILFIVATLVMSRSLNSKSLNKS